MKHTENSLRFRSIIQQTAMNINKKHKQEQNFAYFTHSNEENGGKIMYNSNAILGLLLDTFFCI